jgi:hypothetical protein
MTGGSVPGGPGRGASDEQGCTVAGGRGAPPRLLHAAILHLLGLVHERLTYRHAGRDFRLTDVSRRVVREVIA